MNRRTFLIAAGASLVALGQGRLLFAEAGPRPYEPTTISPADLDRLRAEFLAHTNTRRRAGRPDKAADRVGAPPDLRFDPILNNAAQWFADLAASFENANPGANDFAHDATVLGGDESMRDPVQRLRFFGWPESDRSSPGAGTEANQVFIQSLQPVTGALIADGWMDSSTHYRPFFGYLDKTPGDQTFALVGLGVGVSRAGNYWASAIFGNTAAPFVPLTAAQVAELPAQVIATVNVARTAAGRTPLTQNAALTAAATTLAQRMAAGRGRVAESDEPEAAYQGGTLTTSTFSQDLQDAPTFARFLISSADADGMQAKFTDIGVGIALDPDGTPYIAVYLGHP